MIIKDEDFGYVVHCPICGDDYTHHSDVEVFERIKGEDGKTVILKPGSGNTEPTDYNPSARRNAVSIQFHGECDHFWAMNIIQHKGKTFISFS